MTHLPSFPDGIDHAVELGAGSLMGRDFTLLPHHHRCGFSLAIAFALSLSLGCGTFVSSTYVNAPPHPLTPIAPQDVEVFVSGPPRRDHVDVALLEVEQTQSLNRTGRDYMLEKLREAAGAMGCEAVVLTGATEHSGNPDRLFDEDTKTLIASCIVYTGPDLGAESDHALASDASCAAAGPRRPGMALRGGVVVDR